MIGWKTLWSKLLISNTRSTLSHDFYQTMIGRADMSLYGWKQLILWSIEHSCLDENERTEIMRNWELLWQQFLEWMVATYDTAENKE
jgi:adenosine deaminase CECR1